MKLRGIDFGPVSGASGVQGWFGEGYPWHRYLKPWGLRFKGVTFVAKTTTLGPRKGNMPLTDDWRPASFLPKCVYVNMRRGLALNAVGLSGPGVSKLLKAGKWQERQDPFFLSFMSVEKNLANRLTELRLFVKLVKAAQRDFQAPFGVQLNLSCPNTDHDPSELAKEAIPMLDAMAKLGVPVVPKINALVPVETAVELQEHEACDALCISNTIPWEKLPEKIDWVELFGKDHDYPLIPPVVRDSPLEEFGGGGLSGAPLLPVVCDWIKRARKAGFSKPINAGGGILSSKDVDTVLDSGIDLRYDSVFLGSVAFLRFWRVSGIIKHIYRSASDD